MAALVNELETNKDGNVICHYCKTPVTRQSMGIRTIIEDGRVIRIATCRSH